MWSRYIQFCLLTSGKNIEMPKRVDTRPLKMSIVGDVIEQLSQADTRFWEHSGRYVAIKTCGTSTVWAKSRKYHVPKVAKVPCPVATYQRQPTMSDNRVTNMTRFRLIPVAVAKRRSMQ